MTEQRSPEWFEARRGKVTASKIADVMATGRSGKPSATRANYAADLVAERLSGEPTQGFSNAAMQWGTETEPEARAAYEFMADATVTEVGFIPHPSIDDAGASPDGLVGDDGLVEIKCPNTAKHIATLTGAQIDGKYIKQMQFQMACTGRAWCDFVSYDPRLPPAMALWIKRIHRDDEAIAEIEKAVREFLAEVYETEAKLLSQYMEAAE